MTTKNKIQIITLLIIFVAMAALSLTVFEDGSWTIELFRLRILKGCIPWMICSI